MRWARRLRVASKPETIKAGTPFVEKANLDNEVTFQDHLLKGIVLAQLLPEQLRVSLKGPNARHDHSPALLGRFDSTIHRSSLGCYLPRLQSGQKRRRFKYASPVVSKRPLVYGPSRKLTDCSREGFRAPGGVRKSPRKEPAGGRRCDSYGDFGLRPFSLMARPSSAGAGMDPARRLCCALARCCWFVGRPDAQLLLSISGVDAWVPLAGG